MTITPQELSSIIEGVNANAGDDWNSQADIAVIDVALNNQYFSAEEVWATGLPKPDADPRAMGQVFRRAARRGLIERTTDTVPFVAAEGMTGHPGFSRNVWKSLIYGRNRVSEE